VIEDGVTEDRLDRRLLLRLLGMWAGLVLLPGIITINQPVVVAYVFWGLGFFAALIVFISIARMTETTDLWPWLVASVLPWVINVAVPANPMYIPVFVVAVGGFAAWIFLRASATDRLQHEGVEGTGIVTEVIEPKMTSAVVNNGYVRRSVRLRVERPDKVKTYEAVLRDLFKVEELPSPGDKIALRIDAEDAKRVVAVPMPKPDEPIETPTETLAEQPSDEDGTSAEV
jgi:hypothetical protein